MKFSIVSTLPHSLACPIDTNYTMFIMLLRQTVGDVMIGEWMSGVEEWVGGQGMGFLLFFFSVFVHQFFVLSSLRSL